MEAMFNDVLKAFLESCTKVWREKVTQYKEPDFSKLIATTSSSLPSNPENKVNVKVDPYPTHANYATMLEDHKKVISNNLMTVVNIIMSRLIS